MFVTTPRFESTGHRGQLFGLRRWHAVTLPHDQLFYLFTYHVGNGPRRRPQSTLVASDDALLKLLPGILKRDHVDLCRMLLTPGGDFVREPTSITAVWETLYPAATPIVFLFDDDLQPRDSAMKAVNDPLRALLFKRGAADE